MSSPPSYADLGKSARDLFSKGFSKQALCCDFARYLRFTLVQMMMMIINGCNFIYFCHHKLCYDDAKIAFNIFQNTVIITCRKID